MSPPLKSAKASSTSSGSWVATRPLTSVRSSSLLPDPTAPMISPCGPWPPSADSFRSSSSDAPSAVIANGTRSNCSGASIGHARRARFRPL